MAAGHGAVRPLVQVRLTKKQNSVIAIKIPFAQKLENS
jgi:hypothetical protein